MITKSTCQNWWERAEAVLNGKRTVANVCIRKQQVLEVKEAFNAMLTLSHRKKKRKK